MSAQSETRSLVLNGATLGTASSGDIAAFEGEACRARYELHGLGATAGLAVTCRSIFRDLNWASGPDVIVAVVGPGSFTGLRASLSLANALAYGYRASLRGVTTGACFRMRSGYENAVCLTQARRDRLFAEWADGQFWAGAPGDFRAPPGTRLTGSGTAMLDGRSLEGCHLLPVDKPDPLFILQAGMQAAVRSMLEPLYIDAPEAKLPAKGLRPTPLG